MLRALARLPRQLNWWFRRWSTDSDRAFHDSAFANLTYDPFNSSYPGYVSIRRFADLAEPYARDSGTVLDLGCGVGEITCELARRLPAVQFVGVDHSAEAIARANDLVARLALTNIRFEQSDLERYQPPPRAGLVTLVTMFNAFHHLLDPAGFIQRLGRTSDRFFLIEPSGDWLGQWQKTLDLDWLPEALFQIRDRLEYQWGLTPPGAHRPAAALHGEPTEHRYALDDFPRWFEGFGVDIRGTVAGIERYGSEPELISPLRADIGARVYDLLVALEETLHRHDLDLAAKHWAVYAERGRVFPPRRAPVLPDRPVVQALAGPYDAEYADYEGPAEVRAGAALDGTMRITNRGWRVWNSYTEDRQVLVSYHWFDARGAVAIEDGLRTPLPRPVAPGESCQVAFRAMCPETPGRYTLAVDLVHEGVTWFSRAGTPPLKVAIRVT